jgi:hypothetical protein
MAGLMQQVWVCQRCDLIEVRGVRQKSQYLKACPKSVQTEEQKQDFAGSQQVKLSLSSHLDKPTRKKPFELF